MKGCLTSLGKWLVLYPFLALGAYSLYQYSQESKVADVSYLYCSEVDGAYSWSYGDWKKKDFVIAIAKDDKGVGILSQSKAVRWLPEIYDLESGDIVGLYPTGSPIRAGRLYPWGGEKFQRLDSYIFSFISSLEKDPISLEFLTNEIVLSRSDLAFVERETYKKEGWDGNNRREYEYIKGLREKGIKAGIEPIRTDEISRGRCELIDRDTFEQKSGEAEGILIKAENHRQSVMDDAKRADEEKERARIERATGNNKI